MMMVGLKKHTKKTESHRKLDREGIKLVALKLGMNTQNQLQLRLPARLGTDGRIHRVSDFHFESMQKVLKAVSATRLSLLSV